MGRFVGLLAVAVSSVACLPHATDLAAPPAAFARPLELQTDGRRDADAMLETGLVLRPYDEENWGVHLWFPVTVSWTDFDFDDGVSVDDLAALSLIPTLEAIIPLTETWTLLPFFGNGIALQNGGDELEADKPALGIMTGGVRATRWQHFARRHWFGLSGEVRYSLALTGDDGLLGDWGSLDAAVEWRRDFGPPREGPRFQGGLYVQGFHFWDEIEIEIDGLTPETVENQAEVGISLGTSVPVEVWGFELPRVFLGVLTGDDVTSVRLRFGRL